MSPNIDLLTTQLIIKILGIIAIIGLSGTLFIISININTEPAIITSLITFLGGITGGLIGYLGATKEIISTSKESDGNDTSKQSITTKK